MKTIVFDFDGTLLDSRERHLQLLSAICSSRTNNISNEKLQNYLAYKEQGKNTKSFLQNICGLSEEESVQCAQEWIQKIETWEYLQTDKLYGDTKKELESLKSSGKYTIILLTARQNEELMRKQLDVWDIRKYFDQVICVSPKTAEKDKITALRIIGSVYCVVGDTEVDSCAAKAAQCRFYALNRGFRSKMFWNEKGIASFSDLSQLNDFMEEEF